jgi:hypothetical protein
VGGSITMNPLTLIFTSVSLFSTTSFLLIYCNSSAVITLEPTLYCVDGPEASNPQVLL